MPTSPSHRCAMGPSLSPQGAERGFPLRLPLIASLTPAAGVAAAGEAGLDPLLQERGRAESLAIGLVEDLRHLQAEFRAGRVHQLEWAHRVAEAQLAGGVDVLRGRDPVLDEAHRLIQEDEEHAVDRKAGDILDLD